MKRRGWVVEQVADMENLRYAYWKAKRGKACDEEVKVFTANLYDNLLRLRSEILSADVKAGPYRFFSVYEPKERLICAASFRQRVLHHAIMNICHSDFERFQIYDSYATRLGKGTYKALERARDFHKKYGWCLKLDIRKYFDSIDHNVLKTMLKRLYKDEKLLAIFDKIIDSYNSTEVKGLPIGNLTSQYFANYYLAFLDHKTKEEYKAKAYVRYMDDIMMWDNDRNNLKLIGKKTQSFVESYLGLNLKYVKLLSTNEYTEFLGYRLSKFGMSLAKKSVYRYENHIKRLYFEYNSGLITQEDMNHRLTPIIAFVDKVNSRKVKRKIMAKI